MTDTAVIFDIIGRDRTGPAIAASGSAFNKLALGLAASAAFVGVKFVGMAADFQASMTRVQTGAGEAQANIKADMSGILDMMGRVGASSHDLAAGLYLVNSAGYHGGEGLKVLEIASMGAKVGAADLHTTVDAVTTALNAYHMGAGGAAAATNALIAAEAAGKTNLEALAQALPSVAPAAAVAHVRLNEVLAAMSTMTMQGTPAANAATYLRQAIGQLSAPTQKAAKEMEALGLNSTHLAQTVGTKGLAAGITMLTDAIQSKLGPQGLVYLEKLKKMNGETSDFQKILANLPPTAQTYFEALAKATGGVKSMQAILQLSGPNMAVFQQNIAAIDKRVQEAGGSIEGWGAVQKNFNQRMAETKGTLEALGIRIGTVLLPYAQKMLLVIQSGVNWFAKHAAVAKTLAVIMGTLGTAFILYRTYVTAAAFATKAWTIATTVWSAVTKGATAVMVAFDAAMDANPVGVVILAIVALAAGIYLIWTHSAGFRNFFIGMWGHIWSFLKMIGAWFAGPFARFFVQLGKDMAAPYLWFWHTILEPFIHATVAYCQLWWRIFSSVIHLIADIFTMYLAPAFMTVWHGVIDPFVRATVAYFTWLWSVAMMVWHGIADGAIWLYKTILTPIGHGIAAVARVVADGFLWLWREGVEPAMNGVAKIALWIYHTIILPIWHGIVTATHWLGDGISKVFSTVAGFVAGAFHQAVSIAKNSINALISVVNIAIRGIDSILTKANSLPGVNFPMIPQIPHLASGGTVMVGENGPEIVTLPSGSTVYPHGSRPSADPSGSQDRTVRFVGDTDSAFATAFASLVRRGFIQLD